MANVMQKPDTKGKNAPGWLTKDEQTLLGLVCDKPGSITGGALAKASGLPLMYVNRVMAGLIAEGLVNNVARRNTRASKGRAGRKPGAR